MWLILTAPQVAFRDCADCLQWVYDENTGKRQATGHTGRPIARPPGTAPCQLPHIGCPKGTPEEPKSLNEANVAAYCHYRECRAVGEFPDDPIVRRNAAVIHGVEDVAQRERESAQFRLIASALGYQTTLK